MRAFVLCYLVLVLAGCAATLHDVQQSPPILTISSDLSAKTLANKIAYASTQESLNSRVFRDWDSPKIAEIDNGIWKLLITYTLVNPIFMISYPPIPVAEITISPERSGGSLLEYRGINWTKTDKFIELVKHCATP